MAPSHFPNPFRPGAGHMPPYLAGRQEQTTEFRKLLRQEVILSNLLLTGLRGVGKTVLLDTLKPLAINDGWIWVGTDLSESSSVREDRLVLRLLTDLSVVTSTVLWDRRDTISGIGVNPKRSREETYLTYDTLLWWYEQTPGLPSDKLKSVLEVVWACLAREGKRGLIFAYDEAQNLSDHASRGEYPLSLLLDIFQSLQKKNHPLMLILAGLPTLFPKLVDARTFAERMFRVVMLDRLGEQASREAITKPMTKARVSVQFNEATIQSILGASGGYPYFIQFLCREILDVLLQNLSKGNPGRPVVPENEILRKLDIDFFAGRWARATDRQRDLLEVIAHLENSEQEFTVHEVVECSSGRSSKPFSASHVNQMLSALIDSGLVYKNRHGRYSFAVPLMSRFIRRQCVDPSRG